MSDLGYEINIIHTFPNGDEARFFERGIRVKTLFNNQQSEVLFDFPKIGCPHIATAEAALERQAISFRNFNITPLVTEALKDRFALSPTGVAGTPVVITFGLPEEEPHPNGGSIYYVPATASLQSRQLYDVFIRKNDGSWRFVTPNAVYYRSSWHDFGIAHITDMHVAYRIDKFRGQLEQLGFTDDAKNMYNWNDRFRGFVRYANYLHRMGILDVILATGDLYDYIYDVYGGENTNIDLLRHLILGESRSPEFMNAERLRVPIFMVPGNHDYRKYPYDLIFKLMISDSVLDRLKDAAGPGVPFRPLGLIAGILGLDYDYYKRLDSYANYNLTWEAAKALTSLQNNGNGDFIERDVDEAARFVEIEYNPPFGNLIKNGDQVIKLGDHRIVMLDSGHDLGVTESMWDGFLTHILEREENKETFAGGSPNCEGVSAGHVTLIKRLLSEEETPANGLFIMGLHAPLLNIWEDSNAYFFRESQRAAHTESVEAFLVHRVPVLIPDGLFSDRHTIIRSAFPEWFPRNGDLNEPTLLKRGARDRLLRFGVSHGEAEDELMRVLAGIDAPHRKADVVLAGHTHCHNEFRIAVDPTSGEPTFYTDFYTFNPRAYYPTRFYDGWHTTQLNNVQLVEPTSNITYVEITDEAERNAAPWPMPYKANYKFNVRVPGYHNPLSHTTDPRAWWNEHRPLILQTGALGPMKNNQVDFAGFRLLSIKNDVIEKIHFVSIELLEKNNYNLSWEKAIEPIPDRWHKYVERSRYFRLPKAAGAPASIEIPSTGATSTVYRNVDDQLIELWASGADVKSENLTEKAGAPPAAGDPSIFLVSKTQKPVALYRGANGHVVGIYWTDDGYGHDKLSQNALSQNGEPAPKAAEGSKPVGYYTPATATTPEITHVVYRSEDGQLQALCWMGDADVKYIGPLSSFAEEELTLAKGSPSAFISENGYNFVYYRGTDNSIHYLTWLTGPDGLPVRPPPFLSLILPFLGHGNLTDHLPLAAGDPAAYFLPSYVMEGTNTVVGNTHVIVYRGTDGHLYEGPGSNEMGVRLTGDPNAVSDPVAFFDPATNTTHVVYLATDGHLNEISGRPGSWDTKNVDLTVAALAPPAYPNRKPSAFCTQNPNRRRVVYLGQDNQIHEIHWP